MIRDESGRFTLESTLLFPLIIVITLSCLFISIGTARHAGLHVEAAAAAGRASFAWDNSNKNPITGSFYPGNYDDLYWRLFDDGSGSALALKKLSSALAHVPDGVNIETKYTNSLLQRTIKAQLKVPFAVPEIVARFYGTRNLEGLAFSSVSEPVELIRNVNLVRSYWPLVRDALSIEEAEKIVDEFRKRPGGQATERLTFQSHDEARAYLQKLVRGRQSRRDTEQVGQWRLLDALDANGIAHQAYYGLKTLDTQIRDQLLKDAEILENGQVKGVVWHFFKRERDQSIGLSNKLRKQLEARGIVVVVHE